MKNDENKKTYTTHEINVIKNLLSVDSANTHLQNLDIKSKIEREIHDRILRGMTSEEKAKVNLHKEELIKIIYEHFKENNDPRCPFDKYANFLRDMGITTSPFYRLVVLNDGALLRWKNKTEEWYQFDRKQLTKRLSYLEKSLVLQPTENYIDDFNQTPLGGIA